MKQKLSERNHNKDNLNKQMQKVGLIEGKKFLSK